MLATTKSLALQGLQGYIVSIQVDVSDGMPYFEIVGLPDMSIKESKERVKAAIRNSKIEFNSRRIIVNLAPANTRKEGSGLDLAIAIGVLIAMRMIRNNNLRELLEETIFIGELSLDGSVEGIKGILPRCIEAQKLGIKNIIVSRKNAKEASFVEGIKVIPVENLKEVIEFLNGNIQIDAIKNSKFELNDNVNYKDDFSEVKGQENVKRALEIAAAGGHNCLLIGSPGAGKTMLAKRLPSILPDISFEETLEVSKIYSIAGLTTEEQPILKQRPFRSPHHKVTATSLIGGGRNPKPRRN